METCLWRWVASSAPLMSSSHGCAKSTSESAMKFASKSLRQSHLINLPGNIGFIRQKRSGLRSVTSARWQSNLGGRSKCAQNDLLLRALHVLRLFEYVIRNGAEGSPSALAQEPTSYFVISTLARVFSHSMRSVHLLPAWSNAMVKFSTGALVLETLIGTRTKSSFSPG